MADKAKLKEKDRLARLERLLESESNFDRKMDLLRLHLHDSLRELYTGDGSDSEVEGIRDRLRGIASLMDKTEKMAPPRPQPYLGAPKAGEFRMPAASAGEFRVPVPVAAGEFRMRPRHKAGEFRMPGPNPVHAIRRERIEMAEDLGRSEAEAYGPRPKYRSPDSIRVGPLPGEHGFVTNPESGIVGGEFIPPPRGPFTEKHRRTLITAARLREGGRDPLSKRERVRHGASGPPEREALAAMVAAYGGGPQTIGTGDRTPPLLDVGGGVTGGIRTGRRVGASGGRGGPPGPMGTPGAATGQGGNAYTRERPRPGGRGLGPVEMGRYRVRVRAPEDPMGGFGLQRPRLSGAGGIEARVRRGGDMPRFDAGPTRVNVRQTGGEEDPIELEMLRQQIRGELLQAMPMDPQQKLMLQDSLLQHKIEMLARREQRRDQIQAQHTEFLGAYHKRIREVMGASKDAEGNYTKTPEQIAAQVWQEMEPFAPRSLMKRLPGSGTEYAEQTGRAMQMPGLTEGQSQRKQEFEWTQKQAEQEDWDATVGEFVQAGEAIRTSKDPARRAQAIDMLLHLAETHERNRPEWAGRVRREVESVIGTLEPIEQIGALIKIGGDPAQMAVAAGAIDTKRIYPDSPENQVLKDSADSIADAAREAMTSGDAATANTLNRAKDALIEKLIEVEKKRGKGFLYGALESIRKGRISTAIREGETLQEILMGKKGGGREKSGLFGYYKKR